MILDKFKLDGKVALVSGCRRGIGRGIAVGLAEAGADVIGVSAQLEPDSEVEREIRALGRNFYPYQCDFSDRNALYAFIAQVKREHPNVDILFNNAGSILRKPAVEHPDEYWDKIIEINLSAQFIMTREFGREMIARGCGKIVFTAIECYNTLRADNNLALRTKEGKVDAYISVPAYGLSADKLDSNGNLSYDYKYGREAGTEELSTVFVPLTGRYLTKENMERLQTLVPNSYRKITENWN